MLSLTPTAARSRDEASPAPRSSDRVAAYIAEGLIDGRLVPGQRLIEADIMKALGVSRGPVREGLTRLEGQGVVALTPHRGAHVRALSREEASDLMIVLEALTALSARLAAASVREGAVQPAQGRDLATLEGFCNVDAPENMLIGRRRDFYAALLRVGGNRQLPRIMPVMSVHVLRAQAQPFWTAADRQNIVAEYAAVAQAVLNGDPPAAERTMRRHIRQAMRRIRALPDEAFPLT